MAYPVHNMNAVAKRVLIVIDEPGTLTEFSPSLASLCPDWELVFASTANEALVKLETHPFDVIIADLNTPNAMAGALLLNEIGRKYPAILRFIISNSMDKEMVMKCVLGSHHFLPKPCDPERLHSAVERVLTLDRWLGSESLKSLIVRIRTFPSIPSLYFEVLKELKSPDTSAQRVGEIIARDMAMSTKVLQVLNSAYYALPRQITDPTEAVNILGFEMVRSLVLCIQVFSQFDKVKPTYFSIDKLWRHSTNVAHAARKIARIEDLSEEIAESAYTAGLLHDVGKLILVSNFEAQYRQVQDMARVEKIPLWEAEKGVFGASHGEIGAYLIGVWGMPLSLASAAAFHHNPSESEDKTLGVLALVHVANCLVYQNRPDPDGFALPILDEAYVEQLGLKDKIPQWQEIILAKGRGPSRGFSSSAPSKDRQVPSQPSHPESVIPDWLLPFVVTVGIVIVFVFLIKLIL